MRPDPGKLHGISFREKHLLQPLQHSSIPIHVHALCQKNALLSWREGGYLVHVSDGKVPFLRVSFLPIFSRTGYQKKAIF